MAGGSWMIKSTVMTTRLSDIKFVVNELERLKETQVIHSPAGQTSRLAVMGTLWEEQ